MNIPPGIVEAARREQTASARQTPTSEVPESDAPVSDALANLMQGLGRKEVDRVYLRVFGMKPDNTDK